MITRQTLFVAVVFAIGCGGGGGEAAAPAETAAPAAAVESNPTAEPVATTAAAPSGSAVAAAPADNQGPWPLADLSPTDKGLLTPCKVELMVREFDENKKETKRVIEATQLTTVWSDDYRSFMGTPPMPAPAPVTKEQASKLFHGKPASNGNILVQTDQFSLMYFFDAKGRTKEVTWDPIADSSDYRFVYQYECKSKPKQPPTWISSDAG